MFRNTIYMAFFTVLITASLISCENKKMSFRDIRISAAPHINIGSLDLMKVSMNIEPDPAGRYSLDVIIYGYSQGKETISMKGDNGYVTETGTARIKALVKITDGEKIVRAEFLEISGVSDEELLRNLVKSVNRLVRN